ncbi:MAG: rhodanese-like domain-containing protein [Planctomycetes bacterium]|nr:rhodanese-like domain-containing protein [Planctomycetota bacterium]
MLRASLFCLALTTLLFPSYGLAVDHTKDPLAEVKQRVQEKKAILLDVREQKEWDEGHLKDAVLLPLSKIQSGTELKDAVKDLKKDTLIYCHCRAGRRALTAAEQLIKQGYDVRALKPGYEELLKAGFDKAGDSKNSK